MSVRQQECLTLAVLQSLVHIAVSSSAGHLRFAIAMQPNSSSAAMLIRSVGIYVV